MQSIPKVERRRYPRYIISGDVETCRAGVFGSAKLVQFGLGGMLLRGGQALPVGKRVTAKVKPDDYPCEVEVPAEVVGVRTPLTALKFVGSAGSVLDLGRWLAARNQPVAPPPDSELATRLKQMRYSASIPRCATPRDQESALEPTFSEGELRAALNY